MRRKVRHEGKGAKKKENTELERVAKAVAFRGSGE
jgi:hypothetical protein